MKSIKRNFVSLLKVRFREKTPLIQILMGPRQVGKTTGVLQFLESYKYPYHYANADDLLVGERAWLVEQWQKARLKSPTTLLVIDEIQKISGWSSTIKKLWDDQIRQKQQLKVLLLASSSLSLKKGVTESLAGRFEWLPVYHWNFYESHLWNGMDLEAYLKFGGYPKSYGFLTDQDRWVGYIRHAIIDRAIDKDILQFASVKDPSLFRQAFEIICCYPAQEISYRKLLGQLQARGNVEKIKYYLSLFEGAFLIKVLTKYGSQDYRVKSSSPKILPMAPCFYYLFATHYEKQSFVFESTVGMILSQFSEKLFYWRDGTEEVDFVSQWRKKLIAIEVKSGRRKSHSGLEAFCKLYPKAYPVIISPSNYAKFAKDPKAFLEKLL